MNHFLIIGGTSGIGKAIAEKLANDQNQVITFSRNEQSNFENPYITHSIWNANSTDIPSIDIPKIDGIVYCPGTINLKPFHRFTDEEIIEEFTINTLGQFEFFVTFYPF